MNVARRTWLIHTAALFFVGFALADLVSAQDQPPRVVEVEIKGRHVIVPTSAIKVDEGETVELRWTSDEQVELHIHGYDVKLTLMPGAPGAIVIKAFASGRFPVTSHGWGKGGHAHDALTYLEVHPK